jgi:hypothetical protein
VINRGAIVVRLQEPFVRWINEACPVVDGPGISLESANEDKTIYLITDNDAEKLDRWLKENYMILFEQELEEWYVDEMLWPENRNRKIFNEWIEIECHSIILDTVDGNIIDDET